jgi:S1-C subfamily serine protease
MECVKLRVIGLVGLAGIICPTGFAQSPPTNTAMDPFIGTVEAMRRSVAPVACMVMQGDEAKILYRAGSAFFISAAGDFLTAAHVIRDIQKGERPCPVSAITIPVDDWQPEVRNEAVDGLPFDTSECRIDRDSDLAACRLNDDLSRSKLKSKIAPVRLEWSVPSGGTQVAITGFPMNARDPMTLRAAVSGYLVPWQDKTPIPQLVLDRAAWPGYSGSPVYLSDGRVIGILIAAAQDEALGLAIARPASLVRDWLAEKPKK